MLRYLVERISDGLFTELEFPIAVSNASTAFNGPGRFSGTVAPDNGGLRYKSGELILDPWASFIHEELDGVIRGTWIITRSEFAGSGWVIEGAGFSSYFSGTPFDGEYRGVRVDPVQVARHVIESVQAVAGANIGVTVHGSSDVKVGSDSDQRVGAALTGSKTAKAAVTAAKADLKVKRDAAKNNPTSANKAAVTAAEAAVKAAEAAKTKADDDLARERERQSADGGAWKILWWDTPDALTAFTDAVEAAGMEWFEWSAWNRERTAVVKELHVVPMVGQLQDTLRFIEGDNVIEAVTVVSDGSRYANRVVALGAGEGRSALRVDVGVTDSRRRRTAVLDAKHVTNKSVLESMARAELDARRRRYEVKAVRVIDHPFAPFGTFRAGDVIEVECDVSWIGRQTVRQRITEVERVSERVVDLMLGEA